METVADIDTAITDAELITAVNGHEPPPVARPYWQDQPCPPWCMMVVPHQDQDLPEDRYHLGPIREVTLALEAADVIRVPSADGKVALEVSLPFITAGLYQPCLERDARVVLNHSATHDIELTVTEAGRLAEALAAVVREAAEAQEAGDQ